MKRSEVIATVMQRIGNIKRLMHGQQYTCNNGSTLSGAQLVVLFAVKHHEPISSHILAEKLAMTPGGISQLLDGLIGNELVTKESLENDRRSFTLRLSKKGTALTERIWREHYTILEQTMANFSDNELGLLVTMLDKLAAALEIKAEK